MAFLPYMHTQVAACTPSYAFVRVQQIQHAGGRRALTLEELASRSRSKRLMSKLEETVSTAPIPTPTGQQTAVKEESTPFAPGCRMLTTYDVNPRVPFQRKLEVLRNGHWQTICEYIAIDGTAYKYDFKSGHRSRIELQLPPYVVTEMSAEDFRRNWMRYCIDFCSVPARA